MAKSIDWMGRIREGPYDRVILERMAAGETATAVAEWLQEEMLDYTEVALYRLASLLRQYFNQEVPVQERLMLVKNRSAIQQSIAEKRQKVNAVEELEKLYALQLKRIDIEHQHERKIGKLFGGVGNEIELARRLLTDKARLDQELGTTPTRPQQLDITTGGKPINDLFLRLGIATKRVLDSQATDGDDDAPALPESTGDVMDVEFSPQETREPEPVRRTP